MYSGCLNIVGSRITSENVSDGVIKVWTLAVCIDGNLGPHRIAALIRGGNGSPGDGFQYNGPGKGRGREGRAGDPAGDRDIRTLCAVGIVRNGEGAGEAETRAAFRRTGHIDIL